MDVFEESKRLIVGDDFDLTKRNPIKTLFAGYDKVQQFRKIIEKS